MSKSNTPLGRLAAALAKTSATRHQQRKSKQTQSHLPCIEPTETLPDSTDDVETPREYMPDEILNYYSELIKKFDNFPAALRPVQIKSLITLLNKKSLICLAPTGYGKTLTYVLHGLILNQVTGEKQVTVIVSPIFALTENAVNKLDQHGIKAFHCVGDKNTLKLFMDSVEMESCYIYLSPEVLADRKLASTLSYWKPSLLVVDEGHLVSEWGDSFRRDYQSIYEFSFLARCSIAIFTATLPLNMIEDVKNRVGLHDQNVPIIALSPDRKNIYLELRAPSKKLENLNFVAEMLGTMKEKCEKTLIFVPEIPAAAKIFLWFQQTLGFEKTLYYEDSKAVGYMVNQFTSCTDKETKSQILEEFSKPEGYLRVLISTVAFGFGVDVPNIATTVIFGIPTSYLTLVQEVGRTARAISWGRVIIYPFKSALHRNVGGKLQIPTDSCIRDYLMSNFFTTATDADGEDGDMLYCRVCCCCSFDRSSCGCNNVPPEIL